MEEPRPEHAPQVASYAAKAHRALQHLFPRDAEVCVCGWEGGWVWHACLCDGGGFLGGKACIVQKDVSCVCIFVCACRNIRE